ncbi:MAG: GrpB family protein, partial [Fervidobacterium sp.]
HVGSTAVPGLDGKCMIDVLVGIRNWNEGNRIIKKLKSIGFIHIHSREKGRVFMSKRRNTRRGDIHIHIVRKGTKQYKDMLLFRDYLIKNKKARKEYMKTKKDILDKVHGDRKKYRILKGKYIESILHKING